MTARPLLLAVCLFLAPAARAQEAEPPALHAELQRLLDQPDDARRAKVAKELARRPGVTIETVVSAVRTLPPLAKEPTPGPHSDVVTLPVAGETVRVEIHWFVPASYDPAEPAPLILALHGSGGNGRNMVPTWRGVAESLGALVVAPTDAGENEGYRFSARERDETLAVVRWAKRRFHVDDDRIHVTGVSRGGHLTWDLGTRHPGLWASLAPMIGGPRLTFQNGQNNTRFLENVAHIPIRDLQGSRDHPLLLDSLRKAFARLEKLGAKDAELIEFPSLGHSFEMGAVDWVAFLGGARRTPVRERVVRMAASKGARASWAEVLGVKRGITPNFRPKVDARKWPAMSEEARRDFVAEQVEKSTARLAARLTGVGEFDVRGRDVTGFRLLLTEDMFDPSRPVVVTWNGRAVKRSVRPSVEVLLRDFAERVDRRFLPVAEFRHGR